MWVPYLQPTSVPNCHTPSTSYSVFTFIKYKDKDNISTSVTLLICILQKCFVNKILTLRRIYDQSLFHNLKLKGISVAPLHKFARITVTANCKKFKNMEGGFPPASDYPYTISWTSGKMFKSFGWKTNTCNGMSRKAPFSLFIKGETQIAETRTI